MKTIKAREIMTTPVVTTTPETPILEAIRSMLRFHISGMPVVDSQGRLAGIISEHDIMNFTFSGDAEDTTVAVAMSRTVHSFGPDSLFEEIVNCFAAKQIRRVPILEDGNVVGIISRREVLREMLREYGAKGK